MENQIPSIRAILVEDEDSGRQMLQNLLDDFCPEVIVVDTASNIKSARISILKNKPDVVFMDIKMPHGSAFDLIDTFNTIDFEIIFTTAYGHYAVDAFRVAAVDYLLKPIEPDLLIEAVSKLKKHPHSSTIKTRLSSLSKELGFSSEDLPIGFPIMEGIEYISPAEILRCDGEGNYTNLILTSGKKIMLSKNIGTIEKMLENRGFCRIHNSHIINLRCIQRYVKEGNGYVVLSDGSTVDISRRRKNEFLELMRSI